MICPYAAPDGGDTFRFSTSVHVAAGRAVTVPVVVVSRT